MHPCEKQYNFDFLKDFGSIKGAFLLWTATREKRIAPTEIHRQSLR
jgi:hypothetical protein